MSWPNKGVQQGKLPALVDAWPANIDAGTAGQTFFASRSGIHRISIANSQFFSLVLDEECLSIGCFMDGYGAIPVEVQPGATKAGNSAVIYVKVPQPGLVRINVGRELAVQAARTISPGTQLIKNVNMNLSGTHSGASTFNPLTSFVHPSMVYIPAGWNGATHWMTATPWAGPGWPNADIFEDGLLFNSIDNGLTFLPVNVNASGFANLTNANATGFVATDCRLVFDPLGNAGAGVLYAYQRLTKNSVETLIRQQSTNGLTWTNAAGVTGLYDTLSFIGGATLAHPLGAVTTSALSPSVLVLNNAWRMWVTLQDADTNIYMRLFFSQDGLNFSGGDITPAPWTSDYQGAWHTDVQYDEDSALYVMVGQLQRKSGIGSVYTNINVLYTSVDGGSWVQHPVPLGYTGQDVPAKTQHIYKGCICRVAARRWIFVNSCSTVVGGLYLSLQGPLLIETNRPRYCQPSTAVFDEPMGRWYGTRPDAVTQIILQREPAWSYIGNAGGRVSIVNGEMSVIRAGGQAAIAASGTRMGLSYRYLMRLTATNTTSILRACAESTASTFGLHIEGNVSLLKLAQTGDPGVAYTNDALPHNWELRRDEVPPSSVDALVTTGASTAGSRTITVASSAGFVAGTPMILVGAGIGGVDIATVCGGAPTGTTIIVSANMPLTLASFQVRGTRWKLSAIRDNVTLHTLLITEVFYGVMQFFGSGSADGQGWKISYGYLIPTNAPDIPIT